MKKILFTGLLTIVMAGLFAQDIKSIRKLYDKNDLSNAKTQVDDFVTKNPTNPEGLYLQAKIYVAVASNEQLKNTFPDARGVAFESFKKALDNQKGNLEFLKATLDPNFNKPLIDVYSGYYDQAAATFNTAAGNGNKADFEHAMNLFIKADNVGHFINQQKLGLPELDTNLILNIGKAALNAGKSDVALVYLQKLADANVHLTKEGAAGYDLPYQWLTLHYKSAKDEANMRKYAALGKQYFPKDDYYDAVMLDYYRDKKDHDALMKQYEVMTTTYPDSLNYHFNYANDLFNYVYNSDDNSKITNKEDLLKTINSQLSIANKLNSNDVNTNWLYGQYYYNQGVDFKDQSRAIKGTTPPDVKKKADLNSLAAQAFNAAIPYVDKAMTSLEVNMKKSDKSRYKSISDLMQRIYGGLQQPDKVKVYQAKYDGADTKFIN